MHDAHEFLQSLTVVLVVAALTTVLFHRLRQPVVLGYILAGLIVGPHVPIPLVADRGIVETLSELGVILLMYSLGLEFRLSKLVALAPTAGVTALLQSSLMLWLGFLIGQLFGWTTLESIFTGAIIAISSTTIIARAFDEHGIRGKLRELVVGILIVEDLIAIVLMAVLTGLASGSGLAAGPLALMIGRLVFFLVGVVVVGMLVVPPAARAIERLGSRETTLVASVGFCFAVALLAQAAGYSVALGAFIAGSLVAESGRAKPVEHVIEPVRDMFAAVFFVSVGMLIDPVIIVRYWPAVLVLTIVVVVGKVIGVSVGAFLTGNGMRTSVRAGLSLGQIGEFSFIIAGLGLALRATGEFIYPVAVAVSAITTLLTPWMIRASDEIAIWLDRKLPRSLQTFTVLYGSWIAELRTRRHEETARRVVRRRVRLMIVDTLVLAGVIIATAIAQARLAALVEARIGVPADAARFIILAAGVAIAMPLLIGLVRMGRRLGIELAALMVPPKTGVDPGLAPRRVLGVTLQIACVLIVGVPLAALTQPFVPRAFGMAILAVLLAALAVSFWRNAANLQEHVRAGAQVIAGAIAARSRDNQPSGAATLPEVANVLPGLGVLVAVPLPAASPAVGKTLAELNLRGRTGATVVAITGRDEPVLAPGAQERLRSGDVLALAGTDDAIADARVHLSAV